MEPETRSNRKAKYYNVLQTNYSAKISPCFSMGYNFKCHKNTLYGWTMHPPVSKSKNISEFLRSNQTFRKFRKTGSWVWAQLGRNQFCIFPTKKAVLAETNCDTFLFSLRPINGRNTSKINGPYPSSLVPLFQSECKCETILMKMILICMKIKLHAELTFTAISKKVALVIHDAWSMFNSPHCIMEASLV